MTLTMPEEIIEYTCRIIDGNHNNITRRDRIMHQMSYDLMTVQSDAAIEIMRIARECGEALKK